MNVKPGDLAKIVSCPKYPKNIGRQVVVLGPPETPRALEVAARMQLQFRSAVWVAKTLEPIIASKEAVPGALFRMEPGQRILICDSFLRRIDPPEGWKELWEDTPAGTVNS